MKHQVEQVIWPWRQTPELISERVDQGLNGPVIIQRSISADEIEKTRGECRTYLAGVSNLLISDNLEIIVPNETCRKGITVSDKRESYEQSEMPEPQPRFRSDRFQ